MTEPQPNDGFEWTQAPWGRVLRCRPLAAIADHFFTTASLALRQNVSEWQAVAALAGVPRERLLLLRQVHGDAIAIAHDSDADNWTPPTADGLISVDRSAALVVRVADCAPILLADRRTGAVSALHAGWRSTANSDQLQAAGVLAGSIYVSGLCTRTHNAVFHSFRAAGPQAGRMVGVIRAR